MTSVNAARLHARIASLARFGALPGGGVTRSCWSPPHEEARAWLLDQMRAAGLSAWVDPAGNVIVAGHYRNTVDFGGGGLTAAGLDDLFVLKLDPNGSHAWSKSFGDASNQGTRGVATDASGAVFITGFMEGTVNFGAGDLISLGGQDAFLVKLSASGAHQWSRRFGAPGGGGRLRRLERATPPAGHRRPACLDSLARGSLYRRSAAAVR